MTGLGDTRRAPAAAGASSAHVAEVVARGAEDLFERTGTGFVGGALGAVRPIAVSARIFGAAGVMVGDLAASRIEDGTPATRALARALVVAGGGAGAVTGASFGALLSMPSAARGALEGALDPRRFPSSELARTAPNYDVGRLPAELRQLERTPVIQREPRGPGRDETQPTAAPRGLRRAGRQDHPKT